MRGIPLLSVAVSMLLVSSATLAQNPGCQPGEAWVCFTDYIGPGGTFNLTIDLQPDPDCDVTVTVDGSATKAELALILALQTDALCGGDAGGFQLDPPKDNCVCIADTGPPLIQGMSGTLPAGTQAGFAVGRVGSPATARFDFAGGTTSGTAQVSVGMDVAVSPTNGLTLAALKVNLVNQLVALGHAAVIDVDGSIRVDNVNSTDGADIELTDPGMTGSASITLVPAVPTLFPRAMLILTALLLGALAVRVSWSRRGNPSLA